MMTMINIYSDEIIYSKFLNIRTPKKLIVITLKFELFEP